MNIILLGTPASGKGTQAELLEKKFGFFHFSTGQLLRKLKDANPEINEPMSKGDLVPDNKVLEIIEKFLEEKNLFNKPLIIDGSPRSLYQYEGLKDVFKKHGQKIDLALFLKVSDQEALKRLTARRENPKTGEVYNLITNPPGPEVNEADLIYREDDKEVAVKERLKVQKVPDDLYEALKTDRILVEVNGEQPIEVVFKEVVLAIENVKR